MPDSLSASLLTGPDAHRRGVFQAESLLAAGGGTHAWGVAGGHRRRPGDDHGAGCKGLVWALRLSARWADQENIRQGGTTMRVNTSAHRCKWLFHLGPIYACTSSNLI